MSVILILLAASLSIAICFLVAFIWSVKSGQYEDDYTPSVRMLFDETPEKKGGKRANAQGATLFCDIAKSLNETRRQATSLINGNAHIPHSSPSEPSNKTNNNSNL